MRKRVKNMAQQNVLKEILRNHEPFYEFSHIPFVFIQCSEKFSGRNIYTVAKLEKKRRKNRTFIKFKYWYLNKINKYSI